MNHKPCGMAFIQLASVMFQILSVQALSRLLVPLGVDARDTEISDLVVDYERIHQERQGRWRERVIPGCVAHHKEFSSSSNNSRGV